MKERKDRDPLPEDALAKEFASYLSEITKTFAEPMREGVREQEKQLLDRLNQLTSLLENYRKKLEAETEQIGTKLEAGLSAYIVAMEQVKAASERNSVKLKGLDTVLLDYHGQLDMVRESVDRNREALLARFETAGRSKMRRTVVATVLAHGIRVLIIVAIILILKRTNVLGF